jgi:hypothetical protein
MGKEQALMRGANVVELKRGLRLLMGGLHQTSVNEAESQKTLHGQAGHLDECGYENSKTCTVTNPYIPYVGSSLLDPLAK